MTEHETPEEATPFLSAQEFFDMYTKPMDAESEESPLMYYYRPGAGHLCVFADCPPPEQGGIQMMLRSTISKIKAEHGPAHWIWFGSEAYGRVFDKDEVPEGGLQPGQLQADFGSDPKIREIVMIAGVSQDGEVVNAQRAFERKDGEVVWLTDLEIMTTGEHGKVTGGIPDALMSGVR